MQTRGDAGSLNAHSSLLVAKPKSKWFFIIICIKGTQINATPHQQSLEYEFACICVHEHVHMHLHINVHAHKYAQKKNKTKHMHTHANIHAYT